MKVTNPEAPNLLFFVPFFSIPLKNSEILIYPDETNESFEGIFKLWNYEYSDEYKEKLEREFRERNSFRKIEY